ncbi:hypothetical protein BCR44DRAFT_50003 [Catenaria anguillulae PL171]|uniref:RING-type domain-containing protein n=1 Tax=Catenaria anguillulae PL171 TaxID=765915 RepID=A0A1Y2HVY5_9FUNG|nr:hypothetical protein BCR44DRAFT_50003 [Catenaria anguillulae PL171]
MSPSAPSSPTRETRDTIETMPQPQPRLSQPPQALDPTTIPLPSSSRRRASIASVTHAQQQPLLTRQLSTSTSMTTASSSTSHSREALVAATVTPASALPSLPTISQSTKSPQSRNMGLEANDDDDDDNAPIMLQPLQPSMKRSNLHASFESESSLPNSSSLNSLSATGSSDALNTATSASQSNPNQRITLPRNNTSGSHRAAPTHGSRSHSRQSSVASSNVHSTSRSRPTSGTSTLRTRTRRAHQARSTMASILFSSWTSLPLWTKLRIYFATLYTLAEAALPLAAAIVSRLEPPQEFSPCAGYVRLNVSTAIVACGLLVLLPATIRWEVIQREQTRWDRMDEGQQAGANGEEGRDRGERPKLNSIDQMLSLLRSLLNIAHFVLFIVANLQLFRIRPGIQQCPESPAIFSLTLAWIILFYCKMFLPVTLMMLGCLCLPFLLLFATHLNRRYAEQQRLANKMPEDTLDKLPVVKYLGTFDAPEAGADADLGRQDEAQHSSTRVDAEAGGVHVRSEDAQCVICLDEYARDEALYLLPCKHHFHEKCLKDWFELSRLCPMCKRDLVDMANGGSGES